MDEGYSLNMLTRGSKRLGLPKVLGREAMNGLFQRNPKFEALVRKRSTANAKLNHRKWFDEKKRTKPVIVRTVDEIMETIDKAVPRSLPRDLRDDVIMNIWLAVNEGRLEPNDIPTTASTFIKEEYKVNHNAWGPSSLDVPIWTDSETNLFDIIPEEQALWR